MPGSVSADQLTQPVWPLPAPIPARTPPPKTEVVIVGGGLTGVCLARWLDTHGIATAVIERDRICSGATGRTAGFVLLGTTDSYAAARARWGEDGAREVWEFTRENHQELRAWIGHRSDAYRQEGTWLVAVSPKEAEQLCESVALLNADGFSVEWHDEVPVPASCGGFRVIEDGEVIPTLAVEEIAAPVLGSIYENVEVISIETSSSGVRVHTNTGEIQATAAILATNAYTPRLLPGAPIIPYRGQMQATTPVDRLQIPQPVYADHSFRYWRQLTDGRIVIGGWRNLAEPEEMGDEIHINPLIQRAMDGFVDELCGPHEVTHRWSGVMAGTPDNLPLVGSVPGRLGLYVCVGYNGHGFGFATRCAHLLADSLAGVGRVPGFLRAERSFAISH